MRIDLAPYALQHSKFPVKQFINVFRAHTVSVAFLYHTFADKKSKSLRNPRLVLESLNVETLEIHLINTVCVRNRNAGVYEFAYGETIGSLNKKLIKKNAKLMERLKQYVAPIANFINDRVPPKTKVVVSPFLEHNLSFEAFCNAYDAIRGIFPSVAWINNPVNANKAAQKDDPRFFLELHGTTPAPEKTHCINLDGVDIKFKDSEPTMKDFVPIEQLSNWVLRYKPSRWKYAWYRKMNGINPLKWVDPRKRENWPEERELKEILSNYY